MPLGLIMLAQAITIAPPPIPTHTVPAFIVQIGDQSYRIPLPRGYCRPDPKLVVARTADRSDAAGHILSTSLYLLKCDKNFEIHNDQQMLLLTYFKNYKLTAQSRAEYIAQSAPAIHSDEFQRWMESKAPAAGEAEVEKEFGHTLKINAQAQPLGQDDTCVYEGAALSAKDPKTGETAEVITVTCATYLDGHLLVAHASANPDSGDTVVSLARRLNSFVNSITPVAGHAP